MFFKCAIIFQTRKRQTLAVLTRPVRRPLAFTAFKFVTKKFSKRLLVLPNRIARSCSVLLRRACEFTTIKRNLNDAVSLAANWLVHFVFVRKRPPSNWLCSQLTR